MRNILVIITYFIVPWIALILVGRAVKKGYLWKEDQRSFIALFIGVGIINTIGLAVFWGNGGYFILIFIMLIIFLPYIPGGFILEIGIGIIVAILGIRCIARWGSIEGDKECNEERERD